jgi:hypothetical protein
MLGRGHARGVGVEDGVGLGRGVGFGRGVALGFRVGTRRASMSPKGRSPVTVMDSIAGCGEARRPNIMTALASVVSTAFRMI